MAVSDQIMSPDGNLGDKISLHAHRKKKTQLFIYILIGFAHLQQGATKK